MTGVTISAGCQHSEWIQHDWFDHFSWVSTFSMNPTWLIWPFQLNVHILRESNMTDLTISAECPHSPWIQHDWFDHFSWMSIFSENPAWLIWPFQGSVHILSEPNMNDCTVTAGFPHYEWIEWFDCFSEVSTFWITHPNNELSNNAAAGGEVGINLWCCGGWRYSLGRFNNNAAAGGQYGLPLLLWWVMV